MILLQSLRKGDPVLITFEGKRPRRATFESLIYDPKGARFKDGHSVFSIFAVEMNAEWVTITRE